jgi:LPXTG-site transpeptidase (sortase) family protein
MVVSGQGTYTVDTASGEISFTPLDTFTGTADLIDYQVSDANGAVAHSSITFIVNPPTPPTLTPDTSTGPYNTAQSQTVLINDSAGSAATLITSSLRICVAGDTQPDCTGTELVIANQGTYTVNTTSGVISFTPLSTFTGIASPITYSVTNMASQVAATTYTPTVGSPPAPTAANDSTSGSQGQVQTVNLLTNDSAGTGATLDTASVGLCLVGANPCNATTLAVAGVGSYTVVMGVISFTPDSNYTGTTTISYTVKDATGQTTAANYTITVFPAPVAVNDSSSGPKGADQSVNLLSNDSAGSGASFAPASVLLCGSGQTAPNCNATTVTIANQGTYTVNSTSGQITFSPVANFTGTGAISYVVSATSDQTTTAIYYPTVVPPPTLTPDTSFGPYNTTQTKLVLTNDTAASGANLVTSSLRICVAGDTQPDCTGTELVIANQGTYTVDTASGVISFIPLATFTGTASAIVYSVQDNYSQASTTSYTAEVGPPAAPTASPDVSSGPYNTTQTLSPLANDSPGSGQTFVSGSLFLCDANATPAEVPTNCRSLVVTVSSGVYSVNSANSTVTFVPNPTFSGVAEWVGYQVEDALGNFAHSRITPTVLPEPGAAPSPTPADPSVPPPAEIQPESTDSPVIEPVVPTMPQADPDMKYGQLNEEIVFTPWVNDVAGSEPLIPGTLTLCLFECPSSASVSLRLIETNKGFWSVKENSNLVVFTPNWNWHGTISVTYAIFDAAGNRAVATITAVIRAPKLPEALVFTDYGSKLAAVTLTKPPKKAGPIKERDYVATITAKRLGANWSKKIYAGTSLKNVLNPLGLGHYSMTQLPGEAGNFAVAGHRRGSGGIFKNLHSFRQGDVVEIKTAKGTFNYRFLEKKFVKPSEVGALAPKPKGMKSRPSSDSILTLQTCTSNDINQDRLIVWFELID